MVLGACFGFEMIHVWRQIHPKQPDFQMVGLPFAWLFLPGAILFGYGFCCPIYCWERLERVASVLSNTEVLLQQAIGLVQQQIQRYDSDANA